MSTDGPDAFPGEVTVRSTLPGDIPSITAMCRRVYPDIPPWSEEQLAAQRDAFPEGQFVAVAGDRVVGMAASLIVSWDDYDLQDSYREMTAGGRFSNHDPSGRTLYGAEVMVDPDSQGMGIGGLLYAARRDLVRRLGLLRIRAGARLPGYGEHAGVMSPEDYVVEVIHGRLGDPTLSFQLSEGFRVVGVAHDYIRDPDSKNCAAVIEWINDEVATLADYERQDPRFAPPAQPAG